MGKVRLLLVEDDSDHQRLLLRRLMEAQPDLDIKVVDSGKSFLEAVAIERFGCVILDYNLGVETAADLLAASDDLLRDTPVVVVSSSTAQRVVIESMRRGVADYVPKEEALAPGSLWRSVEQVVARQREDKRERRIAERRVRTLRRVADLDALTGVWNRRYADRLLAPDSSGLGKRDDHRAFLMIDIDHFKGVNDRFGHDAGDRVLRHVAAAIREAATDREIVIRWGGEEFLVVKASGDLLDTWVWADRLRRRIATLDLGVGGDPLALTVSIGISVGPANLESVRAADQALYMAKNGGRNRVCSASMVALLSLASSIGQSPGSSAIDRIQGFLRAANDSMGENQRVQTGPHGDLVRRLAVAIGSAMRLSDSTLKDLAVAALAHDIGKLAVPEALLAKKGALSDDEKAIANEHTRFGAEIAARLQLGPGVVEIVASHHARFDETRSPERTPDQAPSSRRSCAIVNLADAFVAMVSTRPYAKRRSPAEALDELRRGRGGQFDPEVVETVHFIDHALVASGTAAAA